MLIPLNAALICRIKEEVKRVPLYSRTRLVTASPHAIGILLILAVARSCLIVRKDLSEGSVKETSVDRLVEAN